MALSLLTSVWRVCARRFDRRLFLAALSGCLAATYLIAWCHSLHGLLGTSLPVATGIAMAIVVAVICGISTPIFRNTSAGRCTTFAWTHFGLAALCVANPWLIELASHATSAWGAFCLSSAGATLIWCCVVASILLGLPLYWIVRLPRLLDACEDTNSAALKGTSLGEIFGARGCFLLAVSFGLLIDGLVLAPLFGLQVTASLAAMIGGGLFVESLLTLNRTPLANSPVPQASTKALGDEPRPAALRLQILSICVAAAVGSLLAVWPRVIEQLAPAASYLACAKWSALFGGAALGCAWSKRIGRREYPDDLTPIFVCLGLAVGIACTPVAFPWIVYRLLWINSHVSQVWLLAPIRAALPAIAMFPAGLACGLCAATSGTVNAVRRKQTASTFAWLAGNPLELTATQLFTGLAVYLLVQWKLIAAWGVAVSLFVPAWLLSLGILVQLRWPVSRPRLRSLRTLLVPGLALVALAPLWRANYQPAYSARLLFATQLLAAGKSGLDPEAFRFLDEGRNVAVREGARTTYSVWKYSGVQFQIRENGVPKAVVSNDTEVHPNYSAELLPATIPLALHERPQKVLILGLGAGVQLKACLSSPAESIVCTESDPSLLKLVRAIRHKTPQAIDWNDDRLRLKTVDPALLLAATSETFDVIISSPGQASLWSSQPYYTQEFYARVARRLAPGGIFCQRFQFIDFGAGPLRTMARTIKTAFDDAIAMDMAPGEMLFVATNDSQGLVRPGLITRLQAPHIRNSLSQTAWDWSLPLTLGAYNKYALTKLALQGSAPINTALNAQFAFGLPPEVMRWGPKPQEVQIALSPHTARLLDWIGAAASKPEVLRRLSEAAAQQNLMTQFPDQYWSYRAQLREHLTSRPRSKIRHASFESADGLDPEDKRRMEYLTALGTAAKTKRLDEIRAFTDFETPFDPFFSYFLHLEAAELYRKAQHPDPQQELRHRLHGAFFGSAIDLSIHNVIDAITLQLERPEAAPSAVQRFDQLNALLQLLKVRWELRFGRKPGVPKNVLRDAELSLSATEKALVCMDQLSASAGLPADDWRYRREVLERQLVRPLRAYRAQLLPQVGRERIEQTDDAPNVEE